MEVSDSRVGGFRKEVFVNDEDAEGLGEEVEDGTFLAEETSSNT